MFHECRHIKTNGHRCHGAALSGKSYCYFHMNLRRIHSPKSSQPDLPPIEDTASVLLSVSQVIRYLNTPNADARRAGLMLYGLQIAAQLTARREESKPSESVRTLHNHSGEEVDFFEALDNGAEILAPDKEICEPPRDCRNCSRQDSCSRYEEPDEDEEEDEEETEEDDDSEGDEEEDSEQENDDSDEGDDYDPEEYLDADEINRRFIRALRRRQLEREAARAATDSSNSRQTQT